MTFIAKKPEKSLKIANFAFNPEYSVFVAANAGSGKTGLLVRRVLSLLMNGVPPSKILCLTFTNGAAAEMSERITGTLGNWVMMPEEQLKEQLAEFMPPPLSSAIIRRARSLFAMVLDSTVGLRLQTIHGFCQSILARFPLEAGVGTHLSVIDEATQSALLKEARMRLFSGIDSGAITEKDDLYHLVQQLGEYSLLAFLSEMIKKKRDLARFIESSGDIVSACRKIYRAFGVDEKINAVDLTFATISRAENHIKSLRLIADILAASNKSRNNTTANVLYKWCTANNPRHHDYIAYIRSFQINSGENKGGPRLLFTKNTISAQQEQLLLTEQNIALKAIEEQNARNDAQFTTRLLRVGAALIAQYENLKQRNGFMDFDDQIYAASRLLSTSGINQWVMYKLDGGIDHVLVDEAQDTSPEQWQIIRAITEEFFSGKGSNDKFRSLFVVGDEKQSIFRFQGADPAGLSENRNYFIARLNDSANAYDNLALTHSYRSAAEILALVDKVFSEAATADGLCAEDFLKDVPENTITENTIPENIVPENTQKKNRINHQAIRTEASGYCEYWPLVAADKEHNLSAEYLLATKIAKFLAEKIAAGLAAGDIMILVRRRTSFIAHLTRALRRKGLPVAGVDRMRLTDNIIIQDLLAFAQLLLFPEDDLTLAAVLKSPIFSISEEELFTLCHDRASSLYQQILHSPNPSFLLLAEFRKKADFLSPYNLFSELLETSKIRRAFVSRFGEEARETLDIFLEQALLFEQANIPSLQGFINWMQSGETELKRDMEHSGGRIRIMTIHAAKGLQAKLVIIADSTSVPGVYDKIQWQGNGIDKIPLATLSSSAASNTIRKAKLLETTAQMQEYRRLLYVAMTRAEDILIICGAEHGNSKAGYQEGSWYELTEKAFSALGNCRADGVITIGKDPFPTKESSPVESSAISSAIDEENNPPSADKSSPDTQLFAAPLPEESTETTLSPSRPDDENAKNISPLFDEKLRQRGIALHRIIQHIPALKTVSIKKRAALNIVRDHAPNLDNKEQEALVSEALNVIEHPDYAPLFYENSLAEVPVSGKILWRGKSIPVSGRIDRLSIVGNELWIVDYKSTITPPPFNKIPRLYINQMAIYKKLLAAIYPDHKIKTSLLWTAIPRIDWLDDLTVDDENL